MNHHDSPQQLEAAANANLLPQLLQFRPKGGQGEGLAGGYCLLNVYQVTLQGNSMKSI